jgi:hypothetical protein
VRLRNPAKTLDRALILEISRKVTHQKWRIFVRNLAISGMKLRFTWRRLFHITTRIGLYD